MAFIIENWTIIIGIIVAITAITIVAIKVIKSLTKEQLNKVREWLLYAVTLAEKELGGGTGKLKLRFVYDMFIVKFPWLAKIVSFEKISSLVDEALVDMNSMLTNNQAAQTYVSGSTE